MLSLRRIVRQRPPRYWKTCPDVYVSWVPCEAGCSNAQNHTARLAWSAMEVSIVANLLTRVPMSWWLVLETVCVGVRLGLPVSPRRRSRGCVHHERTPPAPGGQG